MLKIDKLYCFIATAEYGEGVTGFRTVQGWVPMIGADMDRVDDLMAKAQKIANASGKKITLCEFDNRKELKTIEPMVADSDV